MPARACNLRRGRSACWRLHRDAQDMTLTAQIAVFLTATVIAVPLFRRFKLSAVLGYLAAGMVIGPFGLGLFGDVDNVLHVSEFGVVMLMFVIGLELQPSRLWVLRHAVFWAVSRRSRSRRPCSPSPTAGPVLVRRHRDRVRAVALLHRADPAGARGTRRAHHAPRTLRIRDPAVPGPRDHARAGAAAVPRGRRGPVHVVAAVRAARARDRA